MNSFVGYNNIKLLYIYLTSIFVPPTKANKYLFNKLFLYFLFMRSVFDYEIKKNQTKIQNALNKNQKKKIQKKIKIIEKMHTLKFQTFNEFHCAEKLSD